MGWEVIPDVLGIELDPDGNPGGLVVIQELDEAIFQVAYTTDEPKSV